MRAEYLHNGWFIPENCALTGVKSHNSILFVSVPRWRHGVPSTLNTVTPDGKLQPWPSWALQNTSSYSNLWYVQSMEVDSTAGVMWVLDVGRLNIFDTNPALVVNGPPKLLAFDIASKTLLSTFVFPNDVAPYENSFLNDLVIDRTNSFIYITDAIGDGALVVYSYATRQARRYTSPYTQRDVLAHVVINNVSYPGINTPADSIAYNPAADVVYFAPLVGRFLFAVPGAVLRNLTVPQSAITTAVTVVGPKPPSDGMAFASNGKLYYGDLNSDAVYEWQPGTDLATASVVVLRNPSTVQWVDTFGFGDNGTLLFTTNKLQLFFTLTMFTNTSSRTDANFRIFAASINAQSYMALEPAPPLPATCGPSGSGGGNNNNNNGDGGGGGSSSSSSNNAGAVAGAAVGCLVGGLLLGAVAARFFYRRGQKHGGVGVSGPYVTAYSRMGGDI
jgi:hypothetical protein